MRGAAVEFPDAEYFIAASRLRPGLDGGYTVATMQRAMQLSRLGGVPVTLLTFDPAPFDGVRDGFAELGLLAAGMRMRNLFEEVREHPSLLRDAALGPVPPEPSGERDTLIRDAGGAPLVTLPFVARPDWHRADAPIRVHADDGTTLGALAGFGALYRLWVDGVVAESAKRAIVVCEAKQLGELLGPFPRSYALIHTVHNAHTEEPYAWDSPMDALWSGWFDVADSFDAVVWLTDRQLADVTRRFGPHERWVVIPHPAQPLPRLPDPDARDPLLAVMVARLVEQKRVQDAVRAWPAVLARHPGARLEVLGDGPHRAELEALVAQLGLQRSIALRGYVPRASDRLVDGALLLLSSRHEGQPLVVLEALSSGTPVVAYDVPYGPSQMIVDGESGALVPSGDVAALAEAVAGVLGDRDRIARMSRAAYAWAGRHDAVSAMRATADLCREVLAARQRSS